MQTPHSQTFLLRRTHSAFLRLPCRSGNLSLQLFQIELIQCWLAGTGTHKNLCVIFRIPVVLPVLSAAAHLYYAF